MTSHEPLGHEELLTLARKTVAAAHDGDRERLESAALRLFDALMDHVDAERVELLRLPPGDGRLIARGQERVVNLLADLAFSVTAGGACQCEALAEQLLAHLALQADDERVELDTSRGRAPRARIVAARGRDAPL
jgi:hypothetical protein